jgi:WD40 repeat protein
LRIKNEVHLPQTLLVAFLPSSDDKAFSFLSLPFPALKKPKNQLIEREREREMSDVSELPNKEANVLKGHEGGVLAARFNGDGNYCLSCGKDRTIRLWNPHRGIHIKTYKSHGREVRDVHVTQ